MTRIRFAALSTLAVLALTGCSDAGATGPDALQQHAEPAPAAEAVSEAVTYSSADYGDSVKVGWSALAGDLCLEVRSATSHGYTTVDHTCGFGAPEDSAGTPGIRVLSDWSSDQESGNRLRWVEVESQRCLESSSSSSHGYHEVTFDCAPPSEPASSPSEG